MKGWQDSSVKVIKWNDSDVAEIPEDSFFPKTQIACSNGGWHSWSHVLVPSGSRKYLHLGPMIERRGTVREAARGVRPANPRH